MLQIVIGTVAIISLSVAIKVDETKAARQWAEYEETDWNEYYAHH